MRVREHHKRAAREFKDWLKAHPDALHEEIHQAFNNIEDRHYREMRQTKKVVSRI